ncbi:MAG: trypsin-like serine protease, partial [Sphingomonadales bacterium]
MHRSMFLSALLASVLTATPVTANTAAGTLNGTHWQAQSYLVGQSSTAALAAGGNPIYTAPMPAYSGVVALSLAYGSGTYSCTGTLLPDRQSIVTAAHCAIGSPGITAFFYGGNNPDTNALTSPAATAVAVSQIIINPNYSGQVVDQNDIAVLRLSQVAPAFAVSYGLYGGDDLTERGYNMAGYGLGSTVGGAGGYNGGAGLLRQGDNRYDYRVGDSDFGGQLIAALRADTPGTAPIDGLYLSDFDNGVAANDASCAVAASFGLGGGKYCNLGTGATEVGVAPGDSGSAQAERGDRRDQAVDE